MEPLELINWNLNTPPEYRPRDFTSEDHAIEAKFMSVNAGTRIQDARTEIWSVIRKVTLFVSIVIIDLVLSLRF